MNHSYTRTFTWSLILVVLQVWLFSPISIARVATPIAYPALLFLLPMQCRPIPLTLYGFAVGALIDYLGFTPGLHASVMTFIAFARYYLVRIVTDAQDDLEQLPLPSVINRRSYILLAEILLIHHIIIYALTSSIYADWGYTLSRMLFGYVVSYILNLMLLFTFIVRISPAKGNGK